MAGRAPVPEAQKTQNGSSRTLCKELSIPNRPKSSKRVCRAVLGMRSLSLLGLQVRVEGFRGLGTLNPLNPKP